MRQGVVGGNGAGLNHDAARGVATAGEAASEAIERIISGIGAPTVSWVTISSGRMPYKVPERTPAMNIQQLIFNDVRGWRSRLEATLRAIPPSEPGLHTACERGSDPRDASASMVFHSLPTLDWPPNLFA